MTLLEVKNVKKVYTARLGSVKVQALSDVNFSVEEGEYVAIMGESGGACGNGLQGDGGAADTFGCPAGYIGYSGKIPL